MSNDSRFIVLFRSEGSDSLEYVQELNKIGFEAADLQIMNVNFDIEELTHHIKTADDFEGLIFTSAKAVTAVARAFTNLQDSNECMTKWREKTNFSIGSSTKKAAEEELNLVTGGESCGNSQLLAEHIIATCPIAVKPFLFPSSKKSLNTIPASLNSACIDVHVVPCYDVIDSPHVIHDWHRTVGDKGLPGILVFFSPSGVKFGQEILKRCMLDFSDFKIASIGPTTTKAVQEIGAEVWVTAAKPNAQELATALKLRIESNDNRHCC